MTRSLRAALSAKGVGCGGPFRWRGHEVMRLEGLTDAVFTFAIAGARRRKLAAGIAR